MKKGFKFLAAFMLVLSAFVMSACSWQKDKNIVSLTVNVETIPEYIVVGDFDEAGITATVKYDDDTTETITITSDMLGNYEALVKKAGKYEVEVLFRGASAKFIVKMVDAEAIYTVNFYDGNNKLVSMQVVEKGHDAVAPSEAARNMDGYTFVAWDRIFTNVTADINVYGIYTKVTSFDETINHESVLFSALNNMRQESLNILQVLEQEGIRNERTNYYSQEGEFLGFVYKYKTEMGYGYEKTSRFENGYYYEIVENGQTRGGEYPFDKIAGLDPYVEVKQMLASDGACEYKTNFSASRQYYNLKFYQLAADGTGMIIEIAYTPEQVLYMKHYGRNIVEGSTEIREELFESRYFTVNPKAEDRVVFPTDIDLLAIADTLFEQDFVADVTVYYNESKETHLAVNDGLNRVCKAVLNQQELYYWVSNGVRYYIDEPVRDSNNVQVYKETVSTDEFDRQLYYVVKENSGSFKTTVTSDGSVIMYVKTVESSNSPADRHEFVIRDGKIVAYSRSYLMGDIYMPEVNWSFRYEDVEVSLPQSLKAGEANAVEHQ